MATEPEIKTEGNTISITFSEPLVMVPSGQWKSRWESAASDDGPWHDITDPEQIARLDALAMALLARPEKEQEAGDGN